MMHKKRIAFFTENLYGGGVERILQILLRHFDYNRYDVTLYSNRDEVLESNYYPTHVKYRHIFSSYNYNDNIVTRLFSKLDNKMRLFVYYHLSPKVFYSFFIHENYDVAIAFIEGYATRILSGSPKNMKKLAWIHIELDNYHWTDVAFRSREEEMACYKEFCHVACVSKMVKEQADRIFKISDKSLVLYNPIEREAIIKKSLQYSKLPVEKKDRIRIITAGTLNQRKGHIRLLHVINRLKKENYKVDLFILGEGEEYNSLHKYIKDNNLQDNIFLLGYKDNPYPYIRQCDIYVCSSYAEGYNTAITEAMILGKAIVSTECSGVREQLGDSEYGIVTENSENGLYLGVKEMLQTNKIDHYSMMAKECGKRYTLSGSMSEIYKLIEE